MDCYTVELQSVAERLVVQRALAMHRELQAIAEAAAHGEVIDATEEATLRLGRQWMSTSFEEAVDQAVAKLEKKTKPAAAASAKRLVGTKGKANAK